MTEGSSENVPAEQSVATASIDPIRSTLRRAGRGIVLQAGALGVRFGLGAGLQIAIAHLIASGDVGRFVTCMLVANGVIACTLLHLNAWLIHVRDEGGEPGIGRLIALQAVVSGSVFVVAQAAAPIALGAFGAADLLPTLRICLVASLLAPFSYIVRAPFERALAFGRSVIPELVALPVQVAVTLGIAWRWPGPVALAIGFATREVVVLLAASVLVARRDKPTTTDHRPPLREVLAFALPLVANSVLVCVYLHLDDAFVVSLLGLESLGHYHMAYRFPAYFMTLNVPLVLVALSVFSRLGDDEDALRKTFESLTRASAYFFFTAGAVGVVTTPLFVRGVLGEEWIPATVPMQLLFALAALRCPMSYWVPLYQSRGKTRHQLLTSVIGLSVLAVAGSFAARWAGITGIAITVCIAIGCNLAFVVPRFVRQDLPGTSLARILARPALVAAVVLIAGVAAVAVGVPHTAWAFALLAALLGIVAVVGVVCSEKAHLSELVAVFCSEGRST